MRKIEGVTSAHVNECCRREMNGSTTVGPCVGTPAQSGGIFPCVQGGYPITVERPSVMSPQERVIEAVVETVTAVIDVVVAVLERAQAGRQPTSQRPAITKPIITPKPSSNLEGPKPPPTTSGGHAPSAAVTSLEAIQDDTGAITVRTGDGYAVRARGNALGWSITAPDGRTTRFSGGQEAHESDGGRWQVRGRGSFAFGSSKVTVETKPLSSNSTSVHRLTVYNGTDRVTIGGLDSGRPTIMSLAHDGRQHDDGLSDGTVFFRAGTTRGESWSLVENGKRKVMGAK